MKRLFILMQLWTGLVSAQEAELENPKGGQLFFYAGILAQQSVYPEINKILEDYENKRPWLDQKPENFTKSFGWNVGIGKYNYNYSRFEFAYRNTVSTFSTSGTNVFGFSERDFFLQQSGLGLEYSKGLKRFKHQVLIGGAGRINVLSLNTSARFNSLWRIDAFFGTISPKIQYIPHKLKQILTFELEANLPVFPAVTKEFYEKFDTPATSHTIWITSINLSIELNIL